MPANLSPLAQTFKVNDSLPQGCFITSVELFFVLKGVAPVEVQIVKTLNGYPTDNVLYGAKSVMLPENINTNASGLTSTKFNFNGLVKLRAGEEYAIKVLTNSIEYKLWTAVMGDARVDNPSSLITQQPALGSLFKSQNNSTWIPEPLQDLTFILNRAKFKINQIGHVALHDAARAENINLLPNPFKITNGQKKVKVRHLNHGLAAGMHVKYFDSTYAPLNNVTFAVLKVVNSDTYIIETAANATATDNVGGSAILSEKNVVFDTTRLVGVVESRDAGVTITARLASSSSVDAADTNIAPGYYTDLDVNKHVHSSINRTSKLNNARSFTLKADMTSTHDAATPVLHLNYLDMQLMSNKINRPSATDVDYDIDGETILNAASVVFNANNVISVPSNTEYAFIKLGAHFKVTVGVNAGKVGYISAIDTVANTITIVGDTLTVNGATTITALQYPSFVSELYNGGTAESKHITNAVTLTKMAAGFRVIVEFNIHSDADIEMYYRTGYKTDEIKLADTMWTLHPIEYKKSVNELDFIEYEYNILDVPQFDEFQFKFVLLSANTAVSPKIKNLRIIAHS